MNAIQKPKPVGQPSAQPGQTDSGWPQDTGLFRKEQSSIKRDFVRQQNPDPGTEPEGVPSPGKNLGTNLPNATPTDPADPPGEESTKLLLTPSASKTSKLADPPAAGDRMKLDDFLKDRGKAGAKPKASDPKPEMLEDRLKDFGRAVNQLDDLLRSDKVEQLTEAAKLITDTLDKMLSAEGFRPALRELTQLMNEHSEAVAKTLENFEAFEEFLEKERELLRQSKVNEELADKIIKSCRENYQKILAKSQEGQVSVNQLHGEIGQLRSEVRNLATHPPDPSFWGSLVKALTLGFWGVLIVAVDAGPAAIPVVGSVGAAVSGAVGAGLIGTALAEYYTD